MNSNRTNPGGAATVGGIIYQLLVTLMELTRFELSDSQFDENNRPVSAQLILEPKEGGGDTQFHARDQYIVTQIKSRSGSNSWSLQDIIKKVFPDLFKGVRLDANSPSYRFVTDGHCGHWSDVKRFFMSLRGLSEQAQLELLELSGDLRVGAKLGGETRRDQFWTKPSYSRMELFDTIVQSLSKDTNSKAATNFRLQVLHLLANFEFCEPLSTQVAQERIDTVLLEFVDHVEDVPRTRRHLLQRLAERIRDGENSIELGRFLKDEGFNAIPSENIEALVSSARTILTRRLHNLGFNEKFHVQEDFTDHLVKQIQSSPIVLVTGPCGAGKSWHCCAAASVLASRRQLVAHVNAKRSATETLDAAMREIWNTAKGHDAQLPFRNAAKRLSGPPPQRIIVIDQIEDPVFVEELAIEDVEACNLQLVLGCSHEAADAVRLQLTSRCRRVDVPEFAPSELHAYFTANGVSNIESIPQDVRRLLRAPFLAKLFCETVHYGIWHPRSEYELFDGYWNSRFGHGPSQADMTVDMGLLIRLARAFLGGQDYPWTAELIQGCGDTIGSIQRLRRSGVLLTNSNGSCELWHDRLLNWLLARMLADDVDSGHLSTEELKHKCSSIASDNFSIKGRRIEYVLMDLLWQLAQRHRFTDMAEVFAVLEKSSVKIDLYRELVPTLGDCAVSALIIRLKQLLPTESGVILSEIAKCIASIGGLEAIKAARELLDCDKVLAQSAAITVLAKNGDPESLERLWEVHVARSATKPKSFDYQKRMDALDAGINEYPLWLIARLEEATASSPCLTDLVYLLARRPDGNRYWQQLKRHIIELVPKDRARAVLRCCLVFGDKDEIEYLRSLVEIEEDFTGDAALAALSRLDPKTAIADLAETNLRTVIFSRSWHFHPLLTAWPQLAQAAMRQLVQRRRSIGALCTMYEGMENAIDSDSFALVLEDLCEALQHELSKENADVDSGSLHSSLKFVEQISSPALVEQLNALKGTKLPHLLGEYLLAIGPRSSAWARLNDKLALRVLQRIDDPVLSEWVRRGLTADNRFGRIDALEEAHKHADSTVVELLRRISLKLDDEDDRFESYLAIHALTLLGDWDSVLEAVIAAGLSVSPYPAAERYDQSSLDGPTVETIYSRLRQGEAEPGLLLAAGLTRDPRFIPLIEAVIVNSVDLPSETRLAATIALDQFQVRDTVALEAILGGLDEAEPSSRLPWLVLQFGTKAALDGVAKYLEHRFVPELCVQLAKCPGWEARAATIAWANRPSSGGHAIDYEVVLEILAMHGPPEARDLIEEIAFGHRSFLTASSRLSAIKALSTYDPDQSFAACLIAVKNPRESSRLRFPALLVELDDTRAAPCLLELLRAGESELFEIKAADALAKIDISMQIREWIQSEVASLRRIACVLAGRRDSPDDIVELLRQRAIDADNAVAREAINGLNELARAQNVCCLAKVASREHGPLRWITIDQIASTARGDRDHPPVQPVALEPIRRGLSPLEAHAVMNSLDRGEEEFQRAANQRAQRNH